MSVYIRQATLTHKVKGIKVIVKMAGVEGFEPSNAGIKSRCLNRLATPHHQSDVVERRKRRNNSKNLELQLLYPDLVAY